MSKPVGKEAALRAFKAMDTDNSGSISFEEFLASIKREAGEDICEPKLREFFKKIDTDKNGRQSENALAGLTGTNTDEPEALDGLEEDCG
ncbi:hypothetical protein SprV_0301146400 [Sparganum proliferum]